MAGLGGCSCTPASAAQPSARAAACLQPRSAHACDAHINVPAQRRGALRAGRRGAASASDAGSQVHLQRRAQRTGAAGNARGAPCTHDAARRRGAQGARQRGATHAHPQSRVLHSAEDVCAAVRILSPAARASESMCVFARVAARRGATGGALRHQQPQYVLCNPSNQAAARLQSCAQALTLPRHLIAAAMSNVGYLSEYN